MTTQEQNEIIAVFMGLMKRESEEYSIPFWVNDEGDWLCYSEQFEYHARWDALMPVVEKIECIYDDHHGYFGVHIHSNSCDIQGTYLHRALNEPVYGAVYMSDPTALFPTKIESTYYAVVKFIQWYNSNLKTTQL